MSSPYRIPDPPPRNEPELDISPAVFVLTVAAFVAVVLLSHDRPSAHPPQYGFAGVLLHSGAPPPTRPHRTYH